MNLKEAARTIGVHYQTAYKWVRSGDLAAVRIGSRYEVSQAAIDQFLANRRTLVDQSEHAPDDGRRASDLHPEDLLEELEVMVHDPIVTVPALEGFVARRASHVLGDTVLVAIDNADGTFRHALIDHPRADRAAFYNAVIGLSGNAMMEPRGFLRGVLARGDTAIMPIVDQAPLRRSLRPELRQYLDYYPIHSLVGAPVKVGGEVRGVIVFTRDHPGQPYTPDDERFVARIAARLGPLVQTADEIDAAWTLRRELAATATDALTRRVPGRPFTTDEVDGLLFAPGSPGADTDLPCVVVGADEIVVTVNPAFERVYGIPRHRIIGRHRRDSVPADLWDHEAAGYERLRSGEIDFHDYRSVRLDAAGEPFEVAVHRVAVREPDATLSCVIAVGRPVHAVVEDVGIEAAAHVR